MVVRIIFATVVRNSHCQQSDAGTTSDIPCDTSAECLADKPWCDPSTGVCSDCNIDCVENSHCEVNVSETQECICDFSYVADSDGHCPFWNVALTKIALWRRTPFAIATQGYVGAVRSGSACQIQRRSVTRSMVVVGRHVLSYPVSLTLTTIV